MSFSYLVKSFSWVNGKVVSSNQIFDNEKDAIAFARSVKLAETVKIYNHDGLVFSQNQSGDSTSYA